MHTLREALELSQQHGVAIGHFNIADLVLLKAVLASAQELNVPVLVGAAEVGHASGPLTSPLEAKEFVQATGVDVLAPAVGNRHGMLASMVQGEQKKRLDIDRIAQIKEAAAVPLTLHGGSGTDDGDLRKA